MTIKPWLKYICLLIVLYDIIHSKDSRFCQELFQDPNPQLRVAFKLSGRYNMDIITDENTWLSLPTQYFSPRR